MHTYLVLEIRDNQLGLSLEEGTSPSQHSEPRFEFLLGLGRNTYLEHDYGG